MSEAIAIGGLAKGGAGAAAHPLPEPAAARGWTRTVVLVWLIVWAMFLAMNVAKLGALEFHDPDDELRLVQVRDLLAGQAWFDPNQHRVDPANGGVAMHWSRLVDVPIAFSMLILRPLLGSADAELATLILVPGLTLLAVLMPIGWMASRTLGPGARLFAVLAVAFSAPAMVQVMPLRIDHHGWQIVMMLVSVATLLDREPRRGGYVAGTALAAWMAISFEGLPLSAWYIALLALWALIEPTVRMRLIAVMQALAISSVALFIVTRGAGDLAQHCDAIAPVHLAAFAWGAIVISVAARANRRSRIALVGGFASAAGGALALIVGFAPQCAGGTFDMIDPVLRIYWYDKVLEGKPLWNAGWALFAQYLFPPLVGLWSTFALARRSEGAMLRWWIFYALFLIGAIALSLLVARSAAFSGALAALPLGWRLSTWIAGMKRPANPLLRAGELLAVTALVFCTVFPIVPVLAMERLVNRQADEHYEALTIACSVRKASGVLNSLPATTILAPLDFGPNVLVYSNQSVLATGHHRGAPAMRAVIDAFIGAPEMTRAIMRQRGIRYVMICPNVQEMDLYRQRSPSGFAARLLAGETPAWLRPVPLPKASGLKMWEVAE